MTVKIRQYRGKEDYVLVDNFFVNTYPLTRELSNWIQPRWEYMIDHAMTEDPVLRTIGIWEDDGQIVAIANHEGDQGEAYFALHPAYAYLKEEMLKYAEKYLVKVEDNGRKSLVIYINDFDNEFESIAESYGYVKDGTKIERRGVSKFLIPNLFPVIELPEGFMLKSLEEDNDLRKVHRVLWRGFDHEGEPPEEGIIWREEMQMAPNFRKDLNIVVEAPDGNFAVYCGMWYEPINKIAYVEPVATDPNYRRMGLGRAAVLEGIRRCGEQGATIAYVESGLPFYLNMGFKKMFTRNRWIKDFNK